MMVKAGKFDAARALEYLREHITPILLTQKRLLGSNKSPMSLIKELPLKLFSPAPSQTSVNDILEKLKNSRLELFEKLVRFFPQDMRPPPESIADFAL